MWPQSRLADNAAYYVGRTMYEQMNYPGAEQALVAAEKQYSMSNVLDQIVIWEGKAQLLQKAPAKAEMTLRRALSSFARSPFLAEAHYYLGRSIYDQMRLPEALMEWKLIIANYKTSFWVDPAYDFVVRVEADMKNCAAANQDYAAYKAAFPMSMHLMPACAYKLMLKCAGACP